MASQELLSPGAGALALAMLAILGYVLFQVRGYGLLRAGHRSLRDLRADQRQVYRRLETLQRSYAALLPRLPTSPRPEPYAHDDGRALALSAELRGILDVLRTRVRPPDLLPSPSLAVGLLLAGRYWRELASVRRELAYCRGLREDIERAEGLLDEMESVLGRLARKPLELRERFGDLEALAEALAEEIAAERQRGTEGLQPLVAEANAVRATAAEWGRRLAEAGPEAARGVVEAEALRPQLLARLSGLYAQAGRVAGIHDQALRALERLDAAQQEIEARLTQLRPPLAEALRAGLHGLQQSRESLAARYGEHDAAAYLEVSQQAWTLVARARSLARQLGRLAEADQRAAQAATRCEEGVVTLRERLARQQTECPVRLDLSAHALERVAQRNAQLQNLWQQATRAAETADGAVILSLLGEVEALAAACRQEQEEALAELLSWRSRWQRIQEVLRRLEASTAEHERLTRAWGDLQGYNRANWPHVEADWYEGYARERAEILAAAAELREHLAGGQATQSAGAELVGRCEALAQRWQRLLYGGQQVMAALSSAQEAERQVQEGVTALLTDLQALEAVDRELPPDLDGAAALRALGQEIMASYRELAERARSAASYDLRQLREEGIGGLRQQLAIHGLSYAQILENERAGLKRRLAELWERWEPLSQRLAKASPATEIDCRGLVGRWEALVQAARGTPVRVAQVLQLRATVEELAEEMAEAQRQFQAERERVRQAELAVARERRTALRLRESVPRLLASTTRGWGD
ncbi:MAG: hypothetical protein QME94_10370, partial [Anaerolineae bacterium]|nr:hypothetical protein [Anaerolineae bacterium]